MTTSFAYPQSALLADYARASVGLVFAAFGLIVLLGAAGMSVDFGYLR